jgi:putative transposase
MGGTWYPQACNFLHLKHRLHSTLEKNLIERVMQYFKDRTECFDDYYPVSTKGIIVISNMYTIGLDYSYTCIIQQLEIKYHLSKEAKLS